MAFMLLYYGFNFLYYGFNFRPASCLQAFQARQARVSKNVHPARKMLHGVSASKHPGTKKGIPLYPNLVNLKSNTMKNTLQR